MLADTLAARVLSEGDAATLRLPGYGMPRADGERRARYVSTSPTKAGPPAGPLAGQPPSGGSDEAGGVAGSASPSEWQVEATGGGGQAASAAGGEFGIDDEGEGEGEEEADDDDCEGRPTCERLLEEVLARRADTVAAAGGRGCGGPGSDETEGAAAAVGPYGFDCLAGDPEAGSTQAALGLMRLGGTMFGDLIVHFSARECVRSNPSATRVAVTLPSVPPLPCLVLLGPRPRPAPPTASREGAARRSKLDAKLLTWLTRRVLPDAQRRCHLLGRSTGPAVHLRIGWPPPSPQARSGLAPSAARADLDPPSTPSRAGFIEDTSERCMGFLAALSPGLAVAQLWLPEPSASSSSTHGGGHLLLDDEMAMIEAAPLVLLEYRYGAATAAVNRSSFTSATAGMFRAPSLATLVAQHASSHAVSYSVAWTPGVRVRAEPSLSARVLGLRRSHTLVQSRRRLDTEEGEWVEIEPADATSDGGVGGWVLANGDAVGYGRLLTPAGEHAATHEWCCGRTALQLQSFENVLRTWRSHPLLKLLCKEHALRALPLVATGEPSPCPCHSTRLQTCAHTPSHRIGLAAQRTRVRYWAAAPASVGSCHGACGRYAARRVRTRRWLGRRRRPTGTCPREVRATNRQRRTKRARICSTSARSSTPAFMCHLRGRRRHRPTSSPTYTTSAWRADLGARSPSGTASASSGCRRTRCWE